MARTSELRSVVEAGDAKLAAEVIDCLNLQKSAGFTIQDVSGNGLLQIAALKNLVDMTRTLLDKGFDINDIDSNHGTALQAAIYMDHIEVINVLLDPTRIPKAYVDTPGGYYGCALQVAAFKGSEAIIERLLEHGADVNVCGGKYDSVLQAAARTGLPSIVELILDAKPKSKSIDVNKEGGVYGTALQAAAKGKYTDQTRYLRRLSRGRVLRQATDVLRATSAADVDYLGVAKLLIARGAKVKCGEGRLGSPINAAAGSGDLDMLEFLVKEDKNAPEEKRKACSSALISAITQKFNLDRLCLVELLVENGADVNFEEGSGLYNRPLTAAAAMDSKEVVRYLLRKKADIDADSGIYGSALRAALSAKSETTALFLIDEGADLGKSKDESFGNVLHLATFSNLDKVVRRLITRGVDVNLLDQSGQTALHIAAYLGYKGIVSTLLGKEAKTSIKDAWGDTPLDIVADVIERESHPGPNLKDLRIIKQSLLEASLKEPKEKHGDLLQGPPIRIKPPESQPTQGTAKPVFQSPIWNPGLNFKATIVDFLEKDGYELSLEKTLCIDDLLYRRSAIPEILSDKGKGYTHNLRWYHLPSNNVSH